MRVKKVLYTSIIHQKSTKNTKLYLHHFSNNRRVDQPGGLIVRLLWIDKHTMTDDEVSLLPTRTVTLHDWALPRLNCICVLWRWRRLCNCWSMRAERRAYCESLSTEMKCWVQRLVTGERWLVWCCQASMSLWDQLHTAKSMVSAKNNGIIFCGEDAMRWWIIKIVIVEVLFLWNYRLITSEPNPRKMILQFVIVLTVFCCASANLSENKRLELNYNYDLDNMHLKS